MEIHPQRSIRKYSSYCSDKTKISTWKFPLKSPIKISLVHQCEICTLPVISRVLQYFYALLGSLCMNDGQGIEHSVIVVCNYQVPYLYSVSKDLTVPWMPLPERQPGSSGRKFLSLLFITKNSNSDASVIN